MAWEHVNWVPCPRQGQDSSEKGKEQSSQGYFRLAGVIPKAGWKDFSALMKFSLPGCCSHMPAKNDLLLTLHSTPEEEGSGDSFPFQKAPDFCEGHRKSFLGAAHTFCLLKSLGAIAVVSGTQRIAPWAPCRALQSCPVRVT